MELTLDTHLVTDVGLAREMNQDRCGAFTPDDAAVRAERGRLFLVADGMGGHVGGDVAAELTLQALPPAYFQGDWAGAEEMLRRAFVAANKAIERQTEIEPERRGMGAAAVAVAVLEQTAVVAHLGDCRAYRVRGVTADRLTSDHSWVQERLEAGWLTTEEARLHAYRNVLTRALGAETNANPTVVETEFVPGDALILCSDGLWGVVDDSELADRVARIESARDVALALVELALERGGPDNIAVAVIKAVGVDDDDATLILDVQG